MQEALEVGHTVRIGFQTDSSRVLGEKELGTDYSEGAGNCLRCNISTNSKPAYRECLLTYDPNIPGAANIIESSRQSAGWTEAV
jgi:hypothetical protein